jgi:hypothetical protein
VRVLLPDRLAVAPVLRRRQGQRRQVGIGEDCAVRVVWRRVVLDSHPDQTRHLGHQLPGHPQRGQIPFGQAGALLLVVEAAVVDRVVVPGGQPHRVHVGGCFENGGRQLVDGGEHAPQMRHGVVPPVRLRPPGQDGASRRVGVARGAVAGEQGMPRLGEILHAFILAAGSTR